MLHCAIKTISNVNYLCGARPIFVLYVSGGSSSSSSAPLVLAAAPWHHQLMPRAAAGTFLRARAGAGVRGPLHSTPLSSQHPELQEGAVDTVCGGRGIVMQQVVWLDTFLQMFYVEAMEGF